MKSTLAFSIIILYATLTNAHSIFKNSSAYTLNFNSDTKVDPKTHSVARLWNELYLIGIRGDYARPTVTARNLYHLSVAMYDAWAIYSPKVKNFYIDFKANTPNINTARNETISFSAYRIFLNRFASSPKFAETSEKAKNLMLQLGYNPSYETQERETPAGIGNTIAAMIISNFKSDGSLEEQNYQTPRTLYGTVNRPMIVKMPGVGPLTDVNFWQPLALDMIIDQSGFPIPVNVAPPLTLHWGNVRPFALSQAEKSQKSGVYLDPGTPPMFGDNGHEEFVSAMEQVIVYSSWLDPKDNVKVDISPKSIGNNSLGKNDGQGHVTNPITKAPYKEQIVPRGDYARVLAEFWADGPQSETPPGHWNVIANKVCDHPLFQKKWLGQFEIKDNLEWDVKMYLTLNGALYDASIAAWGIKGYYQGSRPISAIRYLSEIGQSSNETLPKYNSNGLHLYKDLIELITPDETLPGQKFSHLVGHEGEIAVRSWLGSPENPKSEYLGVGWILGSTWVPYQRPTFVTPPFPGYISGHSTFSRAAAEVLSHITGSKFFPGGLGEYIAPKDEFLVFEDGPSETIKLQWATYYDAADQCSLSRIFGGIHGYIDDLPGRKIGSKIGKKAVAKTSELFSYIGPQSKQINPIHQ